MPKIHIGKDERYPDYYISEQPHDRSIEVTDEELAQIRAADDAYSAAQRILARAYAKPAAPTTGQRG